MPTALPAILLALTIVQPPRYAGTWIAEFKGVTFLRLELSTSNGVLQGQLATGEVHVDDQGVVDAAGLAVDPRPIERIVANGSMLTFSCRDTDEVDDFELRLLGDGVAELAFKLSEALLQELKAEGIPRPKPVRMTRIR